MLPAEVDGAIVCLGDMPQVTASLIDRMLEAFDPARGALVVVPTIEGKRGNPVVWSRRFFPDLMTLEGDVGARHLIATYADAVTEVPLEDSAALTDVDTPDALLAVKAELERMMAGQGEASTSSGWVSVFEDISNSVRRRRSSMPRLSPVDVRVPIIDRVISPGYR